MKRNYYLLIYLIYLYLTKYKYIIKYKKFKKIWPYNLWKLFSYLIINI